MAPLKILYALYEPDALSESYIRAEMDWMEAQGLRLCVWGHVPQISTYAHPREEKIIGGDVAEAIDRFRPDLIHTHWLLSAKLVVAAAGRSGKPLTIRGHSFEFKPNDVERLEREACVRRIWLFPHFVRPGMSDKVRPLPVCYDERRYHPGGVRNRRKVFRASAGADKKGLEEMLEVASCRPDFDFTLAVTRSPVAPAYPDRIAALAPPNLTVLVDLQHEEVAEHMRSSALYFRNHDPGAHPYGMPISAAESMACGGVVVARRDPAAEAYLGDAAMFYDTPEEAVDLLGSTLDWSEEEWARRVSTSLARAERFTSDVVLPEVLEEWRRLTR